MLFALYKVNSFEDILIVLVIGNFQVVPDVSPTRRAGDSSLDQEPDLGICSFRSLLVVLIFCFYYLER